jgi:capsular exopolysaccharide synthesis family protein
LISLQGGDINTLSVVEEATLPTYPIGPNTGTNVFLAALIALILAAGGAFLIEYLDDTIKTDTDVTSILNLPTLGGIIDFGDKEGPSVATDNPKSISVEAYRALRTNIRFSSPDHPVKVLLTTSPMSGEGKTTTVANLGAVFARAGASTIIVDADLRKPRQHKMFQLDNRTGLTTTLVSDDGDQMETNLKESGVPNLRILSSGPRPPNPSELLSSERMNGLLEKLRGQADVVIFDTPPCLAVSDAAVLANRVDGVLLVLEAGKTRREAAVRAKEALEQIGARLLGVVLTKIPAKRRGYGYYYYYYYPSYYSDDDKKTTKKRTVPAANHAKEHE